MPDPERWGIDRGYHDAAGGWHDVPWPTIEAFLTAMGAHDDGPPAAPAVLTVPGRESPRLGPGRLGLEDGTTLYVDGALPPDLPFGYHRFVPRGGDERHATRVIAGPGRCHLPDHRMWGWAVQLYATRSRASWGIGDLADLRRVAAWSAGLGAGMALVSPLHAALPGHPQQASPYFPSSRCFRNPLYLRVEDVPGAGGVPEIEALAAAGRALNQARRIDRDAVWRLKSAALETLFAAFGGDADFDRFAAEGGDALRGYATFCALVELHGSHWGTWPPAVRRPDGAGVAALAAGGAVAVRIRYHSWLQWLLDLQLASASHPVGVVHDLAIGVDPNGADAWLWQDSLALGVRVGAPADEFNQRGQDWGLPPFDPWRLQAAGYEPFIQTVRAGFRHAGGLRFDHVMGLFRLFWIPEGGAPADGGYVRYPWRDLLDILALESHRARAYVVGEDLGTVEDFSRQELLERAVHSYRLLWFEPGRPDRGTWPVRALAAITTHDLPTVAGLWSGADLAAQRSLGLDPNEAATSGLRDKLAGWVDAGDTVPVGEVIERAYRLLGRSSCDLVSATLEDALAVEERPNMPGTVDQWPNWSIALPEPLEVLEQAALPRAVAAALDAPIAAPPAEA